MARKKLQELNDEELKDLFESTSERMGNIRERVDEIEYELARRFRETMAKIDTSGDTSLFKFWRLLDGDARKANSEFFRVLVIDQGDDPRIDKARIRIECPQFLRNELTIQATIDSTSGRIRFHAGY